MPAFATLARERPDALFVAGDAFFASRTVQFASLSMRDRIPATYSLRDYVAAGAERGQRSATGMIAEAARASRAQVPACRTGPRLVGP